MYMLHIYTNLVVHLTDDTWRGQIAVEQYVLKRMKYKQREEFLDWDESDYFGNV